MTLIVVLILSVIIVALGTYAAVGARTSRTTSGQTKAVVGTESAVNYLIEELRYKRLAPCTSAGTVTVPAVVTPEVDVKVICVPLAPLGGHPVIELIVEATSATATRTLAITVQVSVDSLAVAVLKAASS